MAHPISRSAFAHPCQQCLTEPSLVIASDRPKWKSPDRMEGTPEENTAAARGTLAYFGTYSISEPDQTFTLHVDRSLHPNINGTDQTRAFSISGDELKFNTPPFKYPKGTSTGYYRSYDDQSRGSVFCRTRTNSPASAGASVGDLRFRSLDRSGRPRADPIYRRRQQDTVRSGRY